MASTLFQSLQALWDSILRLLGRTKTLDHFSLDELRIERVRLEGAQQRILRELDRLEKEKTELFETAKREPSLAAREVHARRISSINHRIEGSQANLMRIGKLSQVVGQLMDGKQLGRFQEGSSAIVDMILKTDSTELQGWVDSMVSTEAAAEQKLDIVLDAFREAEIVRQETGDKDPELQSILLEIERARTDDAMALERPETHREQTPASVQREVER